MGKLFAGVGCLLAFLAVAAGAFGAHVLKGRLAPEMLNAYEVGARYQMYHALALLFLAWFWEKSPTVWTSLGGWGFIVGTVFFSGSLYALSLTGIRWLGAITPLGGLIYLLGWLALAIAVWKI